MHLKAALVLLWPTIIGGQLYQCTNPPAAGTVANFIGGKCDNGGALSNFVAQNASTCAQVCQTTTSCLGFQFWSAPNTPTCWLKGSILSSSITLINAAGNNLYLRAFCNITAPVDGTASWVGNPNADGSPCFIGLCNVTYTCNAGYYMNGSAMSDCIGNGSQVGVLSPPTPTCPQVTCSNVFDSSGTVIPAGPPFYSFNTYNFTCLPNFIIASNNKSSALYTCNAAGQWVQTFVSCTASCSVLAAPASGSISIVGPVSSVFSGQPLANTVAYFACTSGYTLTGQATSTCLTTGQWSNAVPTCTVTATSTPTSFPLWVWLVSGLGVGVVMGLVFAIVAIKSSSAPKA